MYHDRINLTISALATSPGSSIGIIRISGKDAHRIASKLTDRKSFSHMKASVVNIVTEKGTLVERCLLLPFFAPGSFTGEDVVELHVHGAAGNANNILNMIFDLGADPALNGEFSFRAVLNGKMSLNESFSLNTLINAKNPLSIELSRKISFEDTLLDNLSSQLKIWEYFYTLTTALIDFPDQTSQEIDLKKILDAGTSLKSTLSDIVNNSLRYHKVLGFKVLILGKPNVGKSTLFNALLKKNRAITAPTEGTTRDYISETLYIKEFPVELIDSAGIRTTESYIEGEGVEKSKKLIESADLVLAVIDASKPLTENDYEIIGEAEKKPRYLLYNKVDIFIKDNDLPEDGFFVSSKTGEGLENVIKLIENFIAENMPDTNLPVFFSKWQIDTAEKIIKNIDSLVDQIEEDQIEIIASIIKSIYLNIRSLSGEISSLDIYDKIFSSFCLGK